jgi:hypothetical protein
MEMKLDINDEWIDGVVLARLKSDFETIGDELEDGEELKRAIVTMMSFYMTYENYFKWREEAQVPDSWIGGWDIYRLNKLVKEGSV